MPLLIPDLGAAPAGRLRGGGDQRAIVVALYRGAVADAMAAAGQVAEHPDQAVHDYRKALRRARAILAMVAHTLPRTDAVEIRRALRRARRLVAESRDRVVAPKVLASLELAADGRRAAAAVVAAERAGDPAWPRLEVSLAQGMEWAFATADRLAACLPIELYQAELVRGVVATYRRARRQLLGRKTAKRFHRFRRRSKELSAQLDLLAAAAGPRTEAIARKLRTLSDQLGDAVDRVMVEAFVERHRDAAGTGKGARRLRRAAERASHRALRQSRRAGNKVFRRKAGAFGRRLGKALRRDRLPPAMPIVARA